MSVRINEVLDRIEAQQDLELFEPGPDERPHSISCRRFIEAQASHLFEGCVLQWPRSSMSIQS
jgi:hypothetical protein